MIRDKQQLIEDLLAAEADEARTAILHAGGRILRRRRRWRMVRAGLAAAAALIASVVAVSHIIPASSLRQSAPATALPPQQARIPSLTDDELLALFPGTPVGLVTLNDGKKRLIFPRPGDEARFITRL